MSPSNAIIKEGHEGNVYTEVRTHSQSGQILEKDSSATEELSSEVHARHSPIVAFNKEPTAHPEMRGVHQIEANHHSHQHTPKNDGKSFEIKEPLRTIYGEVTTPKMEDDSFSDDFKNTMQHMQRTTTQETTMPSSGNMQMEGKHETQSVIKTLKKNEQNNRTGFINLKVSKTNDYDDSKLKVDLSSDLGAQKKFAAIHNMTNNSLNIAPSSWPLLEVPNKKVLSHLSEIRRSPSSDTSDELPTGKSWIFQAIGTVYFPVIWNMYPMIKQLK